MLQRNLRWLIAIAVIIVVGAFIDWPSNPGLHFQIGGLSIDRDFIVHEGLDLQGGMQVMLEANLPANQSVDSGSMKAARGIVENRINGLGVSEPLVQLQGDRRIIVELPGINDPDQAIKTFGQTGLLEFIDAGSVPLAEGTVVTTTLGGPGSTVPAQEQTESSETLSAAPTPPASAPVTATAPVTSSQPAASASSVTSTAPVTATGSVTSTAPVTPTAPASSGPVYTTVMTGKDLKSADVGFDQQRAGVPEIQFTLNDSGSQAFADYTTKNVGKYLAIVLDKKVISSPRIEGPITGGNGRITGSFTLTEANGLAIQLKYGSLPIPLKVVQNRTVGPTLGQDSVQRSLVAGIIGLALVMLFMIVYYRLPGLVANVALLIYSLIVFALFKSIPVVLTVAGIAGFVLSIGMAVDANILIFERTREEMRLGKTLGASIEAGFARAWTSIRDSNMSTLITCVILFWFGQNFGASIIKGFALTLGIGVLVSMFTAVFVTRTFLRTLYAVWFSGMRVSSENRLGWLFGLRQTGEPSSTTTGRQVP